MSAQRKKYSRGTEGILLYLFKESLMESAQQKYSKLNLLPTVLTGMFLLPASLVLPVTNVFASNNLKNIP